MNHQLAFFDIPANEPSKKVAARTIRKGEQIKDNYGALTVAHNKHHGNNEILNQNREHFDRQAQLVLNHLLNGEKVSGKMMYELYQIQDTRARIYSIKKAGYVLEEEKIKGGHGAKEWFIKQ